MTRGFQERLPNDLFAFTQWLPCYQEARRGQNRLPNRVSAGPRLVTFVDHWGVQVE
jgi:hypothetical protein